MDIVQVCGFIFAGMVIASYFIYLANHYESGEEGDDLD